MLESICLWFYHAVSQKSGFVLGTQYIKLIVKRILMPSSKKNVRPYQNDFTQSFPFSPIHPYPRSKFNLTAHNYRTTSLDSQISHNMQIDQLIKIDHLHLLRHASLPLPLPQLTHDEPYPHNYIWLFIDLIDNKHLVSHAPHADLLTDQQQNAHPQYHYDFQYEGHIQPLTFTCNNVLATQLTQNAIEEVAKTEMISLDQVRLRAETNMYTSADAVQRDIRRLISWNQIYRANTLNDFQYLSTLYQKIVAHFTKRDFFRKFTQIKNNDLNRLMREEIQFKLSTNRWPFVPNSFREYEEIEEYVPTPNHRAAIINQRILSQKMPVDCPSNCVCIAESFPDDEYFCHYSLVNGWQTKCPNRARKVECQHSNEQDQLRCRNSQIKKHQKKKCRGKLGVEQGESQIEERLTWGIDLYTRNIIYHCLPQFDIGNNLEKINNDQKKYHFIEQTLSKAFNFLGPQGYSIVDACEYIKKHSGKGIKATKKTIFLPPEIKQLERGSTQKEDTVIQAIIQKQQVQQLFSELDWFYADLLIRNYQLSTDKSSFRVHTKGKGAICIDHKGISQGTFIVQYFGQIYQTWRWFDRQDFIKQVMKKKKFKNYMPEFYNIALQKHPDQPLGCDILVVDPSRKGNFSSRFSHSCEPNCGTIITVSNGRYYIGMYAFKDIAFGEELTFDYCSMTESNYEHLNSICLCGMRRCRGYYLQLSNTKIFSNLMDNKNCFFTRNSAILNAMGSVEPQHIQICAKSNIKQGIINNSPQWLIRWIASVLSFIDIEGGIYKQELVRSWRQNYPWINTGSEQQKEQNIEKYSLTSRQELQSIRLQNLITSVDKIKYFLSKNEQIQLPPIVLEKHQKILDVLIYKDDSVLLELQENLIRYKNQNLAKIIETFLGWIYQCSSNEFKMSLFRLCCLIVSHKLLFVGQVIYSSNLLSDIVYFYAFTHTFFSPTEYKSFQAEEITISVSEILGERGHPNQKRQKSRKKYASPFVWGQMASWYKQTIVCPEASLSQDRRGTLSYPLIRSIMKSQYPYEKTRAYFFKMLQEKPANSWPPAHGCDLSFKNPYKLYGTILFQNVHSKNKLENLLPKETLLESCISLINSPLQQKLQLFQIVEEILGGLPRNHQIYNKVAELGGDLNIHPPEINNVHTQSHSGQPRKRQKREEDSS